MARKFLPKIISANDLLIGDVVFLTADHDWSRELSEAVIALTPEETEDLLKAANNTPGLVVGPYALDVTVEDGRPYPAENREKFRERGPSNRPELGRQVDTDFMLTEPKKEAA